MSSVKRILIGVLAAVAAAFGITTIAPTAASAAACDPSIAPYGYIGERWGQLGGPNSSLGCSTSTEFDVYYTNGSWAGRRQRFQAGEITWSPNQGPKMVVAAWTDYTGYAVVNWGTTSPFHYDRFLVRYTSPADPLGVQREVTGGTAGQFRVRIETTGGYRFIIEGCDGGGLGGSDCRQGWTLSTATSR